MESFVFGARSQAILLTVKPKLQQVAQRALKLSEVDFAIVQGNRTQAQQNALYEQGRTKPGPVVTWTRNSNHIGGYAIDVCPYANGVLDWDDSGRKGFWPKIARAFTLASTELGIPVQWGGRWTKPDRPHFELVR